MVATLATLKRPAVRRACLERSSVRSSFRKIAATSLGQIEFVGGLLAFGGVVGRDDGGAFLALLMKDFGDEFSAFGIEAGAGLIEQEELGFWLEGEGELEAGAHAGAEGAGGLGLGVFQVDFSEELVGFGRDSSEIGGEFEVLAYGEVWVDGAIERGVAEGGSEVLAFVIDFALRSRQEVGDYLEEGGLSAPVGAQDDEALAGDDFEVEPAEDPPRAEAATEVLHAKHA
jgi:hypothetical protein